MQFRLGGAGTGVSIGCGAVILLLGLVLISPVGVFLIKTLGWVVAIMVLVVMGILSWLSGSRRGY